jgi:pimeloyl-ACP methyl ester carboxylesterase
MTLQQRQIVINNQLVNYYEHLEAPDQRCLIFLHGWRVDSKIWLPILNQLSLESTSVYLIDLPGFGGSEEPRQAFTVTDYAQVISTFLDKLKLKKVTLIGHSVGGRIAITLGSSRAFEKIILVDSAGLRLNNKRVFLLSHLSKIVSPFFKLSIFQKLRIKIYKILGSEDYLATPNLKDTYLNLIAKDLRVELGKISSFTWIVWGSEDKVTPVKMGKIMQTLIPKSKLILIKKAGHFPFLDQPEEFMTVLLHILKIHD